MANLTDLMVHEQAELERILACAILLGDLPLLAELQSQGWQPEVAQDVIGWWQLAQCLTQDDWWGQRALRLIFVDRHGLETYCRWSHLYDAFAADRDWQPAQVAADALAEIRSARMLAGLLDHFAYAIGERRMA